MFNKVDYTLMLLTCLLSCQCLMCVSLWTICNCLHLSSLPHTGLIVMHITVWLMNYNRTKYTADDLLTDVNRWYVYHGVKQLNNVN